MSNTRHTRRHTVTQFGRNRGSEVHLDFGWRYLDSKYNFTRPLLFPNSTKFQTQILYQRKITLAGISKRKLVPEGPQPPSASPLDPFLTLCPSSFPFASPQNRLPTIPGLPLLALTGCEDNSVRDTSPVEPSLGTTYRRHIYHSC